MTLRPPRDDAFCGCGGTLGVDASSPTGATRLYERTGRRVYRDTAFFERPVRA